MYLKEDIDAIVLNVHLMVRVTEPGGRHSARDQKPPDSRGQERQGPGGRDTSQLPTRHLPEKEDWKPRDQLDLAPF
jgi:hypothetical protein